MGWIGDRRLGGEMFFGTVLLGGGFGRVEIEIG